MLKYVLAFIAIVLVWAIILVLRLPEWIAAIFTIAVIGLLITLYVMRKIRARKAALDIERALNAQAEAYAQTVRPEQQAEIRSMQQDLAEFVPERRASRVAAEDHVASLRPEPFDEQLNLRRFTGAIDTVKRHEHAPATRVKKSSEPVRVASIAVGRGQP